MREVLFEEYQKYLGKTVTIAGTSFRLEKPAVKITDPEKFRLEHTTVYSFPKRGNWATHYLNATYRGNFAPEVARNIILRYSKEGETVVDPFCGSSTSLIEAKLLKRKFIGVDINPSSVLLSWNRLDFDGENHGELFVGDARDLNKIESDSVDLVIAHPPYANIIRYSELKDDLSLMTPSKFIEEMACVASELYRILKPGHFCAILVGDGRSHGDIIPIAYQTMQKFLGAGFSLKEDIIKLQWNCKTTAYWAGQSEKYNFHLIMHEHLFIFRK